MLVKIRNGLILYNLVLVAILLTVTLSGMILLGTAIGVAVNKLGHTTSQPASNGPTSFPMPTDTNGQPMPTPTVLGGNYPLPTPTAFPPTGAACPRGFDPVTGKKC